MPRDPFAIPKLPSLPSLTGKQPKSAYSGPDRRKKKRVSVEDLNRIGVDALDLKPEDLDPKDRRSGITKVLDALDLPRNVIGNIVGALSGVDRSMTRKGTLGLPVVTGSDILGKLGVKSEVAKAIVGFVGDVAMDPLTYLSLGATTGLSVGKHVPKVLKGGLKLATTAAEAIVRGGVIPAKIAKALGKSPEKLARLAKLGPRLVKRYGGEAQAIAKLGGKRSGKILRSIASGTMDPNKSKFARAFFTEFGEKGRTLLRAPFAESGLTLPGKRAEIFKAMAAGTDATLEAIKPLAQAVKGGRGTVAKIAAYNAAGKNVAFAKKALDDAVAANKWTQGVQDIYKEAKAAHEAAKAALGGAKGGAKALKAAEAGVEAAQTGIKALKSSPKASAPFRALQEAEYGKTYLTREQLLTEGAGPLKQLYHGAGRLKQEAFGHGASYLSRRLAGQKQAGTSGAAVAGSAIRREADGLLKPIVDDVVKQTGQNADEVHRAMYNLMDVTGTQLPEDPILNYLKSSGVAQKLQADPNFQKAAELFRGMTKADRDSLIKRGVEIGDVEGYIPRPLAEGFKVAKGAKAERMSTTFNAARVKMERFKDVATGKTVDVTTAPRHKAELNRLMKLTKGDNAKMQHVGTYDLSAEYFNTLDPITGELPGQKIIGATTIDKQFQQNIPTALEQGRRLTIQQHASLDLADEVKRFGIQVPEEQLSAKTGEFAHYTPVEKIFEGFEKHPARSLWADQLIKDKWAVPNAVAGQVREMLKLTRNATEMDKFLALTDKPLNFWKRVTLMHPGYPLRNIVSNTGQIISRGMNPGPGLAAILPNSPAYKALELSMDGKSAAAIGKLAGMGADEALNIAKQHSVIGGGLTSATLGDTAFAKAKNIFQRFGQKWFRFNAQIEDGMRFGTWLDLIEKGMTPRDAALKVIQAMPDLTDLTMFEREAGRRVFPWFCVPDDHRAMTRDGWKTCDQLKVGEDVLTYNVEKHLTQWQPVQALNVFDYDGVLMTLKTEMNEFAFTPNHRWPIINEHRFDYGRQEPVEYRSIVEGYRLRSSHRIPLVAPHDFATADPTITDREAALIGWVVTDGHMRVRAKAGREYPDAVIYQSKPGEQNKIRALLADDARGEQVDARTRMRTDGDGPMNSGSCTTFRMSASLARRLRDICPSKSDLPRVVSRLTVTAARAMWEAMMDAEGSRHPRAGETFSQNVGPVLVAMQLLSHMLDRVMAVSGRADEGARHKVGHIWRVVKALGIRGNLGTIWYKGRVWCPTTANGTWVMEHDGRVIITGNSWMRKNGANMLKLAAEKPAVIAGVEKARRAIEEIAVGGNEIDESIRPDWMSEQQAMQIMGDKDKGTVFLLANWLPFQDVMDLFTAAQTPNEFFRSLLSKIRPDAKFMIEAGAGQDIFKRRPIEPFTTTELLSGMPAALVGRSGTPLDALMAIRPLREAVRTAKDMPDAKTRVLRGLIGGSLQPLTRQRALSTRYVELKQELDVTRSAINRANAVSDNAEVKKLTRRWFQLAAELERLELPGVAKATKKTLGRLGVSAGSR